MHGVERCRSQILVALQKRSDHELRNQRRAQELENLATSCGCRNQTKVELVMRWLSNEVLSDKQAGNAEVRPAKVVSQDEQSGASRVKDGSDVRLLHWRVAIVEYCGCVVHLFPSTRQSNLYK